MCGIFGLIIRPESGFDVASSPRLINRLFQLSESRGKDSAGLVLLDEKQIDVFKRPERARRMIRMPRYRQTLKDFCERNERQQGVIAVMGHSRMVTNGNKEYHDNNQPVIKDNLICIHNGIIVNDSALWEQFPTLRRDYEVDTEVMLALIRTYVDQGATFSGAVSGAFAQCQGANSIALLTGDREEIVLGTTNGSLYFALSNDCNLLVFASEEYILRQTLAQTTLSSAFSDDVVLQISPNSGYVFSFDDLQPQRIELSAESGDGAMLINNSSRGIPRKINDIAATGSRPVPDMVTKTPALENDSYMHGVNAAVAQMTRCERCILPESFPFIEFDAHGVCNYCRTYRPAPVRGELALQQLVEPYRRRGQKADVLVPLSGGRDSSFGIHYIKNVLEMTPIAYTYDWGLVTDLARRNISRMCGNLGIEHILISADIRTKRENVRKNVQAWLRKPALGAVPLFMAGDKQFFYHSNRLRKQMDIGVTVYSMNPIERTDFKVGFCGINEVGRKQDKHYALAFKDRLQMMGYYGWTFATNPAYLNSSLVDSLSAFASYYMIQKDYHILYEYLRWDEEEITSTLLDTYDWETAPDTESTWRIGDGTASFYNYIYYTAAGFSENDTLRSNQIREGMIERDVALELAQRDNQPRYDSMRWYAETIGFDFESALRVINAMPKRYNN